MLGPQEFQSDTYDHSECSARHELHKPARSRVKPPGPKADKRRFVRQFRKWVVLVHEL